MPKIKNMGDIGTLGRNARVCQTTSKKVKNVKICFFASNMGIQKNTRDNGGVMHDKVDCETLFCFQLA